MTDPTTPATTPTPPAEPSTTVPQRWQFWVTVSVLAAFGLFCVVMIFTADVTDSVWKNRMAVFSAFQAIVFTAVGWLFGREVAGSAKEDAAKAKEGERVKTEALREAEKDAATERQRGLSLAEAIDTGAVGGGPAPGLPPAGSSRDASPRTVAGDPLRAFARRLYPEIDR